MSKKLNLSWESDLPKVKLFIESLQPDFIGVLDEHQRTVIFLKERGERFPHLLGKIVVYGDKREYLKSEVIRMYEAYRESLQWNCSG